MGDFTNNNSVATTARVTANRDQVTIPTLWKWTVEGKVFEAGLGYEDTAVAALASIAETTPQFSLQAPASTSLLVIPILVKVSLTNDGSALTRLTVCFTKPAGLCATVMGAITGTAMTSKHALYKKNPALTAQQATALTTVTVATALVAADYIEYDNTIAADAALTTGLPTFGNHGNVRIINFLEDGALHIMTSSAAMLGYVLNSTTDALFKPYLMWAEVTEADLV